MVYPPESRYKAKFNLKTEPGEISLVLFRKSDTQERLARIATFIYPPVLSEEKLTKLCRQEGEKGYFEEGHASYYQTYQGPGVVAMYFRNKYVNKTIDIKQEFDLKNMKIRGHDDNQNEEQKENELVFTLQPDEGRIVICDVVDRDASF